jgi:hypothetical protein
MDKNQTILIIIIITLYHTKIHQDTQGYFRYTRKKDFIYRVVPVRQLFSITSKSRATLCCAMIDHSTSQTVLYWCEECDSYSYNAQTTICLEIKKKKRWVTNDIPFADAYNTEGQKLVLQQGNDQ